MLNPPMSLLKLFDNNLAYTLGIIYLPMKLRNDDDVYLESKGTFYVIDTPPDTM